MHSSVLFLLTLIAFATASVLPTVVERDVQPGRVRLMMWFRKNPNMTFKEFSDYWRLYHTNIFLNTSAVKHNLLKFEQVSNLSSLVVCHDVRLICTCLLQLHVNQEWKQKLISEGYSVPNYDGIMIAEAATIDTLLEVRSRKP